MTSVTLESLSRGSMGPRPKISLINSNEARNRFTKENPNQNCFIVFDIGPCGKLLKPLGDMIDFGALMMQMA